MALSISKIIMAAGIILLFIRIDAPAQSTAHAVVSATVTEVVGTIHSSGMNSEAGTIEYCPGSVSNTPAGPCLLKFSEQAIAPPVTFIRNNFAYAITLPSSAVLKRRGGNETIEADQFNISCSVLNENNQIIYLGARFRIGALQVAGNYNPATPVLVTIHYN
jgi:hypothetical protein